MHTNIFKQFFAQIWNTFDAIESTCRGSRKADANQTSCGTGMVSLVILLCINHLHFAIAVRRQAMSKYLFPAFKQLFNLISSWQYTHGTSTKTHVQLSRLSNPGRLPSIDCSIRQSSNYPLLLNRCLWGRISWLQNFGSIVHLWPSNDAPPLTLYGPATGFAIIITTENQRKQTWYVPGSEYPPPSQINDFSIDRVSCL